MKTRPPLSRSPLNIKLPICVISLRYSAADGSALRLYNVKMLTHVECYVACIRRVKRTICNRLHTRLKSFDWAKILNESALEIKTDATLLKIHAQIFRPYKVEYWTTLPLKLNLFYQAC